MDAITMAGGAIPRPEPLPDDADVAEQMERLRKIKRGATGAKRFVPFTCRQTATEDGHEVCGFLALWVALNGRCCGLGVVLAPRQSVRAWDLGWAIQDAADVLDRTLEHVKASALLRKGERGDGVRIMLRGDATYGATQERDWLRFRSVSAMLVGVVNAFDVETMAAVQSIGKPASAAA